MGRWRDIETDNIGEFVDEGRIIGKLEVLPAMRRQTMRLPDRLHGRRGDAGDLGHGSQRPMGRLVWRRLKSQTDDLRRPIGRDRRDARGTRLVP